MRVPHTRPSIKGDFLVRVQVLGQKIENPKVNEQCLVPYGIRTLIGRARWKALYPRLAIYRKLEGFAPNANKLPMNPYYSEPLPIP